jgi:hypothetical protein
VNLKELAWAAGFFDGEGSVYRYKGQGALRLQIAQVDRRPLDRFRAAVLEIGRVNGPYPNKGLNRKPYWSWNVTSVESGQAVIALLWRFLSGPKREQIKNSIRMGVAQRCA